MNNMFSQLITALALSCPLTLAAYTAYISNGAAGTISILDTATDTITGTISGLTNTRAQAITPNGRYLYVIQANPANSIAVIDTSTNTLLTTITTNINTPSDLAATPNGEYIYVTSSGNANISRISTATNQASLISLGAFSQFITINPAGTFAWVYTLASGFRVINLATDSVGSLITLNAPVTDILFGADGTKVYVAVAGGADDVLVFNAVTPGLSATINVGDNPSSLSRTPDGSFIYVTNQAGNSVSVIRTSDNTVSHTITGVGSGPISGAITPHGHRFYNVNLTSTDGSRISTTSNDVTGTFDLPSAPANILISPLSAPTDLDGDEYTNNFGVCYELYNLLTWTASSTSDTIGYNIYRDGVLIGSTYGINATLYEDHNRAEGTYYTYTVRAFADNGHESLPITITIL
jgi:YVTN family beta-propeller protein